MYAELCLTLCSPLDCSLPGSSVHGIFQARILEVSMVPYLKQASMRLRASQGAPVVKNLPANAGDAGDGGSVSGLGRTPGGGNGNPLQFPDLLFYLDIS